MIRKHLFALAALCCLVPTGAQELQPHIEAQLQHPVLNGALWGGLAAYTDGTQQEIFSIQADTRLTPASTLKLLTTAAALETFGPEYRFQTRLYATAKPDGKGILSRETYKFY